MLSPPEQDLEARRLVWDELQMFYMDTDPAYLLERIAEVLAQSKYSVSELEDILWNEVHPACRINMYALPAPEWTGFELDWLTARILKKHCFGRRRRPWVLGRYTRQWWAKLRPMIEARRRT